MKTTIFLICLVITFGIIKPVFASAESLVNPRQNSLSINELLKNYHDWDQRQVNLTGEVIGQPLFTQNLVCIHILDHEGNAIGIWMEKIYLSEIKSFGRYRVKGDTIRLEGIFHLLCPLHSGDTDIHANKITLIKEGELISSEKPIWLLLILGWLLLLYPGFLMIYHQIKKVTQHKQSGQ